MKISWKLAAYGQIGLHCETGDYDATPPVNALLMDCGPANINPERLAIASYLAFGHWTSGDLELPRKLGPNTATAIERDLSHVAVRPNPIEYYPKPLEIGSRKVQVNFEHSFEEVASTPQISVVPSSDWNGAIRGLSSITIASNAFALDAAAASSCQQAIRARLAVAVLLAGDLSADTLVLNSGLDIGSTEQRRLASLLLATRLGIEF